MPQAPTVLRIPQPCAESWAAMIPTGPGRHCAACQKTVVDFTLKTDAEILTFFQQAGALGTCGQFRASQLGRPLRPAVPAASAQRWRAWLAALALWGLRAEAGTPPTTGATLPPSAYHPPRKVAPALHTRQAAGRLVSGLVRDQQSHHPVARAQVLLQGGHRTATTDARGYFQLWVPTRRGPHRSQTLVVQRAGFAAYVVRVPLAARAARTLQVSLLPAPELPPYSEQVLGGAPRLDFTMEPIRESRRDSVTAPRLGGAPKLHQPLRHPWHHWLTRPFRH